ncbi:hypothetical protein [Roseibium marinum]|uniref:Tox-PAAR-like domain-containing protein n=1 Tax=Roseibium marinum TaxID=281252 RepID=A0A2S3V1M3_9HYPH|nr:hypothetical protein [Roseibium marinum]POF33770.1 hypothetical protein CLV41_101219 [Roseibium marinum]
MPFLNSSGPIPSVDLSPVDPYLQVTPVGPVPMVVPAAGFRASTIPSQFAFYYIAFFIHTMLSIIPACIAGPGPGLISGLPMSASRSGKGSIRLLVQGQPAGRSLMDMPFENGLTVNSVGITSPGQPTVLNPTG